MTALATPKAPELQLHQGQSEIPSTESSTRFAVATTADEVLAAWRVVYDVYVQTGFINPNPHLIHTWPQVFSPSAAVLYCKKNDRVEATMTSVVDGPSGLPLDKAYHPQLDALRRRGMRLTEHGLFAHVRQLMTPAVAEPSPDSPEASPLTMPDRRIQLSILELMRLAFYFAISRGSTDMVIGVNPRHAPFYSRAFGFEQAGPVFAYAAVNDRPVVLLHGNLGEAMRRSSIPFAIEYCLRNPISSTAFETRFAFRQRSTEPAAMLIGQYLRQLRRAG